MNKINKNDLRSMKGKEGLILRGCGGEAKEWLDGINKLFAEEGLLQDDTEFSDISVFEDSGVTCILFPFDESVKLDMGRLAVWKIESYDAFHGIWLSDYVENSLGGFETSKVLPKPDCPLIGQDGNVFNLLGIAARTLRQNGMSDAAKEMTQRVHNSRSYGEALVIISDYVNITSVDDEEDEYNEDDELFEKHIDVDEDDEDFGMDDM